MTDNGNSHESLLAIEQISVSYGARDVLSDLSLHVDEGEIVMIAGSNGCGKSTLLKTVAGIINPKKGAICFGRRNIAGMKPHEISRMGLTSLMQGDAVFPSLTVMEHLRLARRGSCRKTFDERLELVWQVFPSLYSIRDKRAGFLSGGEKQSLAFSTMIIQDARFWLLDEPTSRLSSGAAEAVIETIRHTSASRQVGVLLVEQNLFLGLQVARRVCVLKRGAISPLEDPKEILDSKNVEEIFFN
jgi:branched-chain amino acid transport system ATP-binding protein